MRVQTSRLELIASTAESAEWELHSPSQLASWLAAACPDRWPPPLNDEASQRWNLELLRSNPRAAGWGAWYVVCTVPRRELIGNGGFKGPPSAGWCEIGYSLLPQFQAHGYATEAARAWIAWALSHPDVDGVTAETLPDLVASIRVMEKCGMQFLGEGHPEEGLRTVRYGISREERDRQRGDTKGRL
jgi:RimJ/RimL family protein N-acetyltransferase